MTKWKNMIPMHTLKEKIINVIREFCDKISIKKKVRLMYNLGCKVYFSLKHMPATKKKTAKCHWLTKFSVHCDYANDGNTFHDAYGGVMHADR